jgi:hypothetical protein
VTPGAALALSLALPAKSLAWRGGSKALAQWLPSGGLANVQSPLEADVELKFDVRGAGRELKLEFGDIEAVALTRGGRCRAAAGLEARKRPRAARPADFRIYRAHYPCRGAGGKLRVVEAGYPPYLPRRLLFFGHGFLPSAREVELPMGAAPAQSYAYAGADSLDAVDEAARRALAEDFPQYVAQGRYFAFNWGVQKSHSGNEAYSIGIYELRGC